MNQQAAPRRIYRSRTDRMVAGVAGGFGRYLGVDPAVVRIVVILLAFAGGLGLLLYLAAWLVLPDEPIGEVSDHPGAATRAGAPPRNRWTILVVVALLLVVAGAGAGLRAGVIWPLALIGFGVAVLWLRAADGSATAAAPASPAGSAPEGAPAPDEAPHWAADPSQWTTSPAPPAVDPTAPSAPWSVPQVTPAPLRRAAPVIGRIVIALAAAAAVLVASAAAVLALEGPGSLNITPPEAALAAVLAVIVAVAVGLRIHRVPDLVVLVLPVMLVFALAAWVTPPFRGGFGTRDVRPADTSSLEHGYRLAGGALTLDLSGLDLAGRSRSVDASVAAGRLRVVVPAPVTVVLDAHVDAGRIDAFGLRDSGVDVSRRSTSRVEPTPGARTGTLRLHARVGFGQIEVERPSPTAFGAGSASKVTHEVAA